MYAKVFSESIGLMEELVIVVQYEEISVFIFPKDRVNDVKDLKTLQAQIN